MTKAGYGSNEFFNKVTVLLKGKYDKEISAIQGDAVTLQHIKLQSLILLEVLEELRKFSQKTVEGHKPASTSNAANNTRG